MKWPRVTLPFLLAISLSACATAMSERQAAVPFQVLLHNQNKTAWKPTSTQTEAFLFLNEAKDLAAYPIAGTSDPVSSPFPPAELGQVSFVTEAALFMTTGLSPHSPTGLEVSSITRTGSAMTVRLKMIKPRGEALAMVELPVTLIKISRDALPSRPFKIHFVDETGKAVRELTVP